MSSGRPDLNDNETAPPPPPRKQFRPLPHIKHLQIVLNSIQFGPSTIILGGHGYDKLEYEKAPLLRAINPRASKQAYPTASYEWHKNESKQISLSDVHSLRYTEGCGCMQTAQPKKARRDRLAGRETLPKAFLYRKPTTKRGTFPAPTLISKCSSMYIKPLHF